VARAPQIPRFPSDGAPVSVLVDYDGTISRQDVGDELLARFAPDPAAVTEQDRRYDAGLVGSRDLMRWDMEQLPRDAELLRQTAASIPQDETLAELVSVANRHRASIEIVSDGLAFYLESNLARMGLGDLSIATNENRLDGPAFGLSFPYGHPRCFVCGTCKRERVRAHQSAGRAVVFVGDGTSDRFAAAHADVVFAKHALARMCEREGWPFHRWRTLAEVADWLDPAFESGDLPATPAEYEGWRATRAPAPRAFICGPEVWGPDRTTPGPGPG
jgi:2-hydroxy-3-keto-5-methylthiopentenyl-1-phosphate phosphatase